MTGANTGATPLLSLPLGPGGSAVPFALFYGFSGADRDIKLARQPRVERRVALVEALGHVAKRLGDRRVAGAAQRL